MPIKAISFDLWNTLYYDHKVNYGRHDMRVKYFRDALLRNGYDGELDIEGAFKYCWEHFDDIWKNDHRTMNAAELLQIGCKWLGVTLPEPDFADVSTYFEEVLLEQPPVLFDGVKEIVPELANRFKLGITSDTAYTSGRVLRILLERDSATGGLLKYFSAFAFSDEVGRSKPHQKAFKSTLSQLGVKPEEAIHVGDNEGTDIVGAKNVGMKSILFKGAYEREMSSTKADLVANDWGELKGILLNLRITN
jgi:putative hydrolase of the HAD superfamily